MMVLELKDREIILRIGTGFSSGIRAVSYTTTGESFTVQST